MTGFDASDVTVSNAALSNFLAVDGNTYTADITPNSSGDISIDVAAAVVQDAAGNDNTAAAQANVVYDAVAPTVDIRGEPAIVNSTDPFLVSFEFSEDVSGFDATDVSLANASIGNFIADDANTYTAEITPDGTGDVLIDVAAAVAQDAAGNDNTAATQASVVYDGVAPSVDIQGEPVVVGSTDPFNVTFEFSEDVSGFTIADISLANATASNFVTVDAKTYTADISPDAGGDITIDVAAAVAQDAAGNDNIAATQASVEYDAGRPGVDIQGAPSITNSAASFSVTFAFNEDVFGFDATDVALQNATLSNFTQVLADSYNTADITPDTTGDISIDVAAAVAQDAAGNDSTAAAQAVVVYDVIQPSVDIQGEPAIVNSTASFPIIFQFSEDVTGFAAGDVSLTSATLSDFLALDGDTYTADVTPDETGEVTIDVAASVAQDVAGNDNTAATQAIVAFDATAPSVAIQGAPEIVNSMDAFSVTFEFSEDVTGFDASDISIGNAAVSNFLAVDGNTYTADITPDAGGDISIDVVAAVAQDVAGNDNTAATPVSISYDATAPSVDIQGEPVNVNSTDAFAVTFEFSEDVTGFDIADISVSNAAVSDFAATDGNTYTADITPNGAGDISIDVAAAVAQDAAANDNTAATQANVVYDATAPSVDILGEPVDVNNTAAFPVKFEFSEDVSGFDIGDVSVSNATVSNFVAVDGVTYTADITPNAGGDISIDVAAAVAQDAAGNANTAADQANVVYDATAPDVAIQGSPGIVNSTDAFQVTFEISEDVTGFDATDISVSNASVSNFVAVDATTYTADVTPRRKRQHYNRCSRRCSSGCRWKRQHGCHSGFNKLRCHCAECCYSG